MTSYLWSELNDICSFTITEASFNPTLDLRLSNFRNFQTLCNIYMEGPGSATINSAAHPKHLVGPTVVLPDKKRNAYSNFFPVQFTFLGSSNLINKIVTTGRFVTKLQYDVKEYPYLYLA